ncbi:hypothetical protein K450DRAFT_258577 [Umbelopsis ramanniana AG]|uniref:DNA-(apurinic or apyrimidinic site) endonuclease n=1 Tax=Umbelopsis ramanniana AG TaxID=1314678 RepID=A0AAD5HBC0_UMBRA|nr:uncharacterized protein K450DRAFT_258577 [Umbelopsis ramanniana AG]KAI8576033.1 hypothetical protein K450DRAFT_258577 [Umbelopsis ramanniana AG]
MRIVTWNINGISTILQYHPWCESKKFKVLLDALDADIICLQEIKCRRTKVTKEFAIVDGYDAYFSFSRSKHGYSGVAVYVRQPLKPISAEEGITGYWTQHETFEPSLAIATDSMVLDAEGRCVVLEFELFVLFCIYFPNDASEERRMYKMDYHQCVQERAEQLLRQGKQVIIAGDVNAMHREIDCCDPKNNMKEWGISNFQDVPGRRWVDDFLFPKGPMVDMTRYYHPTRKGMFTCWNTKIDARASNYGTRIDYVLASKGLEPWFKYSDIQPDFRGSDHCPVYADFHDVIEKCDPVGTKMADHIRDHLTSDICSDPCQIAAVNFEEYSNKQKKLSNFFSAKRPADDDLASLASQASTIASQMSNVDSSETDCTSQTVGVPKTDSPAIPIVLSTQVSNLDTLTQEHATNSVATGKTEYFTTKRKKLSVSKAKSPVDSNQSSLSSFFTRSSTKNTSTPSSISDGSNNNSPSVAETYTPPIDHKQDEEFVDIEQLMKQHEQTVKAGTQWNALFTPRKVPTCNVHKEPCKEFVVNKKGVNHGRRFYLCSRPVGPQDGPDSNEYRCDYFMWQTELDKKRSGNSYK